MTTNGPGFHLKSTAGRWVLLATVLGSGLAMLDGTVVNIALPSIGEEFDAELAALQWTVNSYTLTLAGLLLLAGALGDRFGRRRVFIVGVVWFTVASVICAVSPSVEFLIGARALQGVGAALLTPGSLAIIEATFRKEDRGAAIGAWSGLGGVAIAIGPFVGGYLIDAVSWRLIFLINVPLAAIVLWAAIRHVPETKDETAADRPIDITGAVLAAVALAGITLALTDGAQKGWGSPFILVSLIGGIAALAGFFAVQARSTHPMMPLGLFRTRQFSAANAMTFVVYAALAANLFLLPIQLQQVSGYTPLQAGASLIPITIVMLLLSARSGRLAGRIGPRLQMTVGPLIAAVGMLLLTRVGPDVSYVADLLPALLVYGVGLAIVVAPLTATVMGTVDERFAGVASAINNDVSRVAGLVAVAVVPLAAGITGGDYRQPSAFDDGFERSMVITAALCATGGIVSFFTIRNPPPAPKPEAEHFTHCGLDGPPLRETAIGAS